MSSMPRGKLRDMTFIPQTLLQLYYLHAMVVKYRENFHFSSKGVYMVIRLSQWIVTYLMAVLSFYTWILCSLDQYPILSSFM